MHPSPELPALLTRLLPTIHNARTTLNLNLLAAETTLSSSKFLTMPSSASLTGLNLTWGSLDWSGWDWWSRCAGGLNALFTAVRAAADDEDRLLNGIWIGLVIVEALMVLGVVANVLAGRWERRKRVEKVRVKRSRSLGV
ncbi:hypothetical protein VTJ83DRAFT_5384 [Remersonia thermophila]|uniref:Transmembrane protein n=1 Tax=Remersonia thermophila TaxID=72144 RepID=A0ABR4D6P2_9PEZI